MSMRALRQLTENADEHHREAMKTIHEELGEAHLSTQDPVAVANRRSFMRNLTLGGAAVAFGTALVPAAGLVPAAMAQVATTTSATLSVGDDTLVRFARGLELALKATYNGMIATGKLTGAPLETARTFARHHNDHATALTALLPKPATTDPATVANDKITVLFTPRITGAADANALIQIAFEIETGAASTYQLAMGTLDNWQTAGTAATIEPIEAQHAVVWAQALNLPTDQWMPAFQTTANAFNPSQYAAS
ncbi:MAG TPA: ferritin-like domain-containing protein [Acidimicrobiales bacterium]